MTISHSALVDRFEKGDTEGDGSRMFIEGDTLYSFGRHFPMLVRMPHWLGEGEMGYILNADKYSITTSKHQGLCSNVATIQVPFSALDRAIPYWSKELLNLVDHSARVWDIWYVHEETGKRISEAQYWECHSSEVGAYTKHEERRPEAAVLEYAGNYYLSSMDEANYFICKLPHEVKTVAEAFECLIPDEVKGKEYIRQGEWFFVEHEVKESLIWKDAKGMYKYLEKSYTLPHKDNGNPHTATRGGMVNGVHLVSGQVKHPEHRMTRLSTSKDIKIYEAYENKAIGSWSASGRVD